MDIQLNPQQQKAAFDTDGAILVIAGAGSGKTRVLTARICNLIERGVPPYQILAITFTNKAANEMKERVERALGPVGVWTSTFHSLCARILRMDIDRLGYTSDFSIYTEQESERVVKRVLSSEDAIGDVKRKAEYLWHISRAKTNAMSPDEYFNTIKDEVKPSLAREIYYVYQKYEEELKRSNALDFDDLLLKTVQLFNAHADVLQKYQNRFKYINIDEFQDTNRLQYDIAKLLSAASGNIFVVGDEDQSIYSWRGADIKNILDFSKDFPNVKVYKLEQNYRSSTSILKAANNVIKNNVARNEKTLWSDIEDDSGVEYYEAYNDRDEADYVSRKINILSRNGYKYCDSAVLVRANSLTRQFEEYFNLYGIPYKVFGGYRFFERKEIKDALAYIRLALNPSDNDSLLRIINYPKRGIGLTAVQELSDYASRLGITLFAALHSPEGLSNATAKKLASFTAVANDLIDAAAQMEPKDYMQFVITRSGLEAAFKSGNDPDDENRLENVRELVAAVEEFSNDNPNATINDFMQSVALVSDSDSMDDDDYVSIATVHAVKGLEFENVFMVGMEEGIFPTQRAITEGDLEEERRLAYVAITRAKRHLYVTNARQRFRFNQVEYYPRSRFVTEMSGVKQSVRFTNSNYTKPAEDANRIRLGANNPTSQDFKRNTQDFINSIMQKKQKPPIDYSKYRKGAIVEHNKFGRGVIVQTVGEGEDAIASIQFPQLGVKRFSLFIAAPNLKVLGYDGDEQI